MWKKLFLALAIVCAAMQGCQWFNPIGPIIQLGILWKDGEAHKYYNTDQKTLEAATRKALADLNMTVQGQDAGEGPAISLRAGTDGRTLKIRIASVNDRVSKLSIRVNIMGDKPLAELVYRHVDQQPGVKQFATLKELNAAAGR